MLLMHTTYSVSVTHRLAFIISSTLLIYLAALPFCLKSMFMLWVSLTNAVICSNGPIQAAQGK